VIYLLTAIRLTPGGRRTVHIYTQTVNKTYITIRIHNIAIIIYNITIILHNNKNT